MVGVEEHLESIAVGIEDAVNARDFNIDSPIWRNFAPAFRGTLSWSLVNGPNDPPMRTNKLSLAEFLHVWTVACEKYPDYQTRIIDVHADVKHKSRRALVYSNLETRGITPGIRRQLTVVWDFERIADIWMIVKAEGHMGMDPSI